MSSARSRRAIATFRQRIGEDAFADHMRRLRAKRKDFGKPFRLDYVDEQGRTGSEIAAAAGRIGGRMRASGQAKRNGSKLKHKQETTSEQNQNQQSAGHSESMLRRPVHNHEPHDSAY